MERLIYFLGMMLITVACHKGTGEFVIKGVVTDETFQTSLEGAVVTLYKVPIGTSDEQFVKSLILDANGSYQFNVTREKMERYIIKVEKPNYFSIEKDLYYSQLSISQDNLCNLGTKAMSWAKIHFKNINPLPSDHFRYIKQEGLAACLSCCPSSTQNFYGPLDTTFYCINNGNTNYSLYYWEMNTSNNGLKSVLTNAFDTTLIEVIY
jgi:hypothetical protein